MIFFSTFVPIGQGLQRNALVNASSIVNLEPKAEAACRSQLLVKIKIKIN